MTYECSINLERALDWQRSRAPILRSLIQKKQAWYEANHCDFWNNWVVDVFNLETANEFGLSVWSIILDEQLFGTTKKSPPDYPTWGFNDDDDENFFDGSFGANADTGYNFSLEQKRIILRLKAYIISMSGNVPEINRALANIFGAGRIACFDNFDMSLTYFVYSDELDGFMRELQARDKLPRPAGVSVSVTIV